MNDQLPGPRQTTNPAAAAAADVVDVVYYVIEIRVLRSSRERRLVNRITFLHPTI